MSPVEALAQSPVTAADAVAAMNAIDAAAGDAPTLEVPVVSRPNIVPDPPAAGGSDGAGSAYDPATLAGGEHDFGDALHAMRNGGAVARASWRGRCYVGLVGEELLMYTPNDGNIPAAVQSWRHTTDDILATDWVSA